MKNLATFETHERAQALSARLRDAKFYSAVFGNHRDGYTVLVNEQHLGTANELLTASLASPEVSK